MDATSVSFAGLCVHLQSCLKQGDVGLKSNEYAISGDDGPVAADLSVTGDNDFILQRYGGADVTRYAVNNVAD